MAASMPANTLPQVEHRRIGEQPLDLVVEPHETLVGVDGELDDGVADLVLGQLGQRALEP